jgi:hypothetical protein
VGAAFAVLAGLLWWRGRVQPAQVLVALGAVLILAGALIPNLLPPVHRVWMAGALALSKITTPILMGVVYFGVITPIGLIRRAFGHNLMRMRRTGSGTWITRDSRAATAEEMERQF